ncbi:hypothetical protein KFE25_003404 [Diacronema lutheri]|uniref:Uncharacterized protein n=1 Tax=Diacronema lutheri TaxID=2081491 RepID=A0A8J5XFT7_DIALT|nr:hypothetical protein KFE25_003404 [Diacronema lutheri]
MRATVLLWACAVPACAAYFDIQLLSDYAKLKIDKEAALRVARIERGRFGEHRRVLQESTASEAPSGSSFWDRLGEEGKSPGKRAAITTLIAVAVVVVVCLCCWCVPILEIVCWGKARDDNALNETYLPQDKPPPMVNRLTPGEAALPIAAGDQEFRAR